MYKKVNWINEQEGTTTPLNAENLNTMDSGIADLDERVTELEEHGTGGGSADKVTYDDSTTSLGASNVQEAIEALDSNIDGVAGRMSTAESNIDAVETKAETNESNIASLTTRVGNVETKASTNETNIATIKTKLNANNTDFEFSYSNGKYGYKDANGNHVNFRNPVGNATADKVLAGYTFSNAEGDDITGTYTPSGITLQEKNVTITENGTGSILADSGYDGMSKVNYDINVQPKLQAKTLNISSPGTSGSITPDTEYDGLSKVNYYVNVPIQSTKTINVNANGTQNVFPDINYTAMSAVKLITNVPQIDWSTCEMLQVSAAKGSRFTFNFAEKPDIVICNFTRAESLNLGYMGMYVIDMNNQILYRQAGSGEYLDESAYIYQWTDTGFVIISLSSSYRYRITALGFKYA